MAREINEVADQIAEAFKEMRKSAASISWEELYRISDVKTWKDARTEQTIDRLRTEHGLLADVGENVLVVCRDKNFRKIILP